MVAPEAQSVCVCIAAYNAEGTIARAIASALAQDHVAEVVVVDDASTDSTAQVAERCDDGSGRLIVHRLARNAGPSAARNVALSTSRANIFCVLDSDDFFLPGRIGRLLAADIGEWDFLADDILIVPEPLTTAPLAVEPDDDPQCVLDLAVDTFVLSNISVPGRPRAELGFLKPLIRRRFLDTKGLRYDPQMRLGEDYALYVSALLQDARFKVVGFCGYVAVERSTSLSSMHRAADLDGIRTFDGRCLSNTGLSRAAERALAAHYRATTDKWALARALEIRRAVGVGAAMQFLASQRKSLRPVLTEIVRAKSTRLARATRGNPLPPTGLTRRLIGQGSRSASALGGCQSASARAGCDE